MTSTPTRLIDVRRNFLLELDDCKKIAVDADSWFAPTAGGTPLIDANRRGHLVELAFLRACLAWEVFIEQAFILFANGNKSPRETRPIRYVTPPSLLKAREWVVPEGRPFASWNDPGQVMVKAERFFEDGKPFSPVLRGNQTALQDIKTLRNAIAHKSSEATAKFETLARRHLGTLPIGLTVGSFLNTTVRGSSPPFSFLEQYIDKFEAAARQIVRTS